MSQSRQFKQTKNARSLARPSPTNIAIPKAEPSLSTPKYLWSAPDRRSFQTLKTLDRSRDPLQPVSLPKKLRQVSALQSYFGVLRLAGALR
ncbi:MAG: hypothetical protein NTW52_13275 [Planctomycetota bacterium]|nr:hypothetical protein [Planctomycetota bacterium]